jgi:hypothetical protein
MSEIEMLHQLPRREIFRLRNDVPERSCLWDAVHFLAGHSVEKVLADDMHKRQFLRPCGPEVNVKILFPSRSLNGKSLEKESETRLPPRREKACG